jgi:hypothetical protein
MSADDGCGMAHIYYGRRGYNIGKQSGVSPSTYIITVDRKSFRGRSTACITELFLINYHIYNKWNENSGTF